MAGQFFVYGSTGGYTAVPKLSKQFRLAAAPLYVFRQFVEVKEAIGLKNGDKKLYDKWSRITTGGGTVAETDTVKDDGYTVVQDTVTVSDYANGIPYTEDLEKSSEFDVNNNIHVIIRDDIANTYDKAVGAVAKTAKYIAVCTGTTRGAVTWVTNGTVTATASNNMSDKNVKDVIDYMKKAKIPRFKGGKDYIGIVSIDNEGSLHDALTSYMQYTTPEFLYNSEIGRFYNCRFVEENNVLSNTAGNGSKAEAIFLGGDALWEALVFPEELRFDTPKDLGRSRKQGWVGRQGFKKVWDYSTDTEEHIVYVTSK